MSVASRRPRPAPILDVRGVRLRGARACVLGLLAPRPRRESDRFVQTPTQHDIAVADDRRIPASSARTYPRRTTAYASGGRGPVSLGCSVLGHGPRRWAMKLDSFTTGLVLQGLELARRAVLSHSAVPPP